MIKQINRLLSNRFIPVGLKIISLIALILLIYLGFLANSDNSQFLKQLRSTNLGNLIVWCYWWPIIIFLSVFFGRIWCMVCPVELITSFFAKIGLKKKRGSWIFSGWGITIFYIIILFIGIEGLHIHRNPTTMAYYLLTIVGVSIIIGLIYEKNTFCRYFCPVGYLLALYSRLSIIGWRVKDKSICESCKDKSCIKKSYTYKFADKSCGVDLYPANINDNSDCILCAGCLKTCSKYNPENIKNRPNPGFIKIGFAQDLYKLNPLKVAEAFFVFIVSGFVINEILSEWDATNNIMKYLPKKIIAIFNPTNHIIEGILVSITLYVFIPLIIWLVPYIISRLIGLSISLKNYFIHYGITFIPLIAAAHLSKSLLKSTSRLPYFKHIFSDVSGMINAQKILDKDIILSKLPEWLDLSVSILLTLFILCGLAISIKTVKLSNQKMFTNNKKASIYYIIPIVYGLIFLITIMLWRWTF